MQAAKEFFLIFNIATLDTTGSNLGNYRINSGIRARAQ
jgi:hypothetical protein